MKPIRLLVLFFWLSAQLALAVPAFSTLTAPAALQIVAAEDLHAITGGVCSSCKKDPQPGDPPAPRKKDGSPYWEHTHSREIMTTYPAWRVQWTHSNTTNSPATVTAKYTERQKFSWSVSGGVPTGIVRSSLGHETESTTSMTITATVPPKEYWALYIRYPSAREKHTFTRWQDYDDRTRTAVNSASATSTRLYTATEIR